MRKESQYVDYINSKIDEVSGNFGKHLSISLTDRCPLKCSHCIVSSLPSNDFSLDLPLELATKIAKELGNISPPVKQISFTGGEPFLAIKQMKLIIDSAKRIGIKTGAVTSAYWANSINSANKTLDKVKGIDALTLSYDIYHKEYVEFNNIRNAVKVANEKDISVSIRFCIVPNPEKEVLGELEKVREEFGDIVHTQQVVDFGRAKEKIKLNQNKSENIPVLPCLSSGPHIGRNGKVIPCCSTLDPHIKNNHPLSLGDVNEIGLRELYTKTEKNYLLNHIRLWGFPFIVKLLKEKGVYDETSYVEEGQCSLCAKIMHNDKYLTVIKDYIQSIDFKLETATASFHQFNNSNMLNELIESKEIEKAIHNNVYKK